MAEKDTRGYSVLIRILGGSGTEILLQHIFTSREAMRQNLTIFYDQIVFIVLLKGTKSNSYDQRQNNNKQRNRNFNKAFKAQNLNILFLSDFSLLTALSALYILLEVLFG